MPKLKHFKELKLLNLQECHTVSEIVRGMEFCSFGARMLGEVTSSLEQMILEKEKPLFLYDGKKDTPLANLLLGMKQKGYCSNVLLPEDYARNPNNEKNLVVIGSYSERYEEALTKAKKVIFINNEGKSLPGQMKEGYYPDLAFLDPRLALPLLALALKERIDNQPTDIKELINQELPQYGGVARQMAHGAYVLKRMKEDSDCDRRFLTLSGAMTIAKMGLIICDLIDNEIVNALSSTGALMAHGLVESIGLKHLKYNPILNDQELARQKLNRVTDTLEPETNLDHVDEVINAVLDSLDGKDLDGKENLSLVKFLSPVQFNRLIGQYLMEHYPKERGILKSAYEKNVPVFVPAFVDSEIGNDVYVHNQRRKLNGGEKIIFDLEADSERLVELSSQAKKIGIFTIGGGVPRNNVQNVACLIELMNARLNSEIPEHPLFYGVRIAPDPVWLGHLSGCTYSEGMSWRKFDTAGMFAEITADATVVLPFLAKYVLEVTTT